jgi:hypothetical protein
MPRSAGSLFGASTEVVTLVIKICFDADEMRAIFYGTGNLDTRLRELWYKSDECEAIGFYRSVTLLNYEFEGANGGWIIVEVVTKANALKLMKLRLAYDIREHASL